TRRQAGPQAVGCTRTSAIPASRVIRLSFSFHCKPRTGNEIFLVGQTRGLGPRGGGTAIAHGMTADRDLRAGLQIALADARARQRARTFGFETPGRDFAVVTFYIVE